MSRWLAIAAVCAGCGRFGFGAEADAARGSGGGSDAGSGTGSDGGNGASCAGFDLCDQFEDATLAPIWEIAGAVTHDPLAHRGTASLRLAVPAVAAGSKGGALIRERATLSAGTPDFWVRVWVRFDAHSDVKNNLELLSADQFSGGGLGDYLFAEADQTALYSQFDNGIMAVPVPVPLDTWTCLIWHVSPSGGTMTLAGDVGSTSFNGVTNGTPPLSVIDIGPYLESSNTTVDQAAFNVWIDDVIVHHAAVTCDD